VRQESMKLAKELKPRSSSDRKMESLGLSSTC
jgi:hypothetical protein